MFRTSRALPGTALPARAARGLPARMLPATALTLAGVLSVAACGPSGGTSQAGSGSGGAAAGQPASPGSGAPSGIQTALGAQAGSPCAQGARVGTVGIVNIACNGSAKISITAGSVSRTLSGGLCQELNGKQFSALAGVITDHTYTGAPVDEITVLGDTSGGATAYVVAKVGGKTISDQNATLAVSDGGKSAHASGTSDDTSGLPGTAFTVNVTC